MKLVSLDDHPEWKSVFAELPNRILADSEKPYVLNSGYAQKILDLKFPVPSEGFFLEDSTGEFFGRILLQGSVLDKSLGHFGLFNLSPLPKHQEMFRSLMPEIEAWFKYYGITKIVGPYLFTTFFPYRFRSDSHPERYAWEPNQPAIDLEIMKSVGFKVCETYFTSIFEDLGSFKNKGEKELEEVTKRGYKLRAISKETIEEDVKIIYELSMKGFTENHLFAPIPFELFKSIYVPNFQSIDLRLCCIHEDPHGKPVGYNFTFVMDDQIIFKSSTMLPEVRGMGLFNAGVRYGMLKGMELYPHVKKVTLALIHDQNAATTHVADKVDKHIRHEYVLLSKDI